MPKQRLASQPKTVPTLGKYRNPARAREVPEEGRVQVKKRETFEYRLKALRKANEYHRKRELVMRFRREDKLLAQVLHRQGWSLERIARRLRVSRKQVWKWVKPNPSLP